MIAALGPVPDGELMTAGAAWQLVGLAVCWVVGGAVLLYLRHARRD